MAGPLFAKGLSCESCLEKWGRVMVSLCLTCEVKTKNRSQEVRDLLKTFHAISGGEEDDE